MACTLVLLWLSIAHQASAQAANRSKAPGTKKKPNLEGYAKWYDMPANALPRRRAPKGELTAASNQLPLGTKVRVTHLANHKNVTVRITDQGNLTRGTIIDLSKEAAAKLDMLREGSTRVRLEIVPDDKLPASRQTPAW